ncbi:uncharacterized protein LOC108680417 isoform X2 [Hyalella azteca]|uniref:Uncharacterized protein LOC108680417 isoform X2 n=1 Tax=Hyalella azteca TaxID=294128 RepID=A0A8B7PF03_HYAAZ|nr:uncharacterized protein LOC108680417 isoform X2 [Hyalella azteca]
MSIMTHFKPVQVLADPLYAKLDEISRCLHFDDFLLNYQKENLIPALIDNSHKKLRKKVLWFSPMQPRSEHNYFGNVSFIIKWESVLKNFGPNLYLLDQAIFNRRSFTRVVLTRDKYDELTEVDLHSEGSPLLKSESGYSHATECMNRVNQGPHELQIAIEVDEDDMKPFFYDFKICSNNHSEANSIYKGPDADEAYSTFESFKCYKYNTKLKKKCPYQYTLDVCQEALEHNV